MDTVQGKFAGGEGEEEVVKNLISISRYFQIFNQDFQKIVACMKGSFAYAELV